MGRGGGRGRRLAAVAVTALLSSLARAEDAGPRTLGIAFRGRLEWLTVAAGSAFRDTAVNPGNAVLALPQAAGSSELRPDIRLEQGGELQAILRPRLLVEVQKSWVGGASQAERSDASIEWLDLYASWRLDDRLTIAYGLQSFQWGPAELMSPSNRIFHETGFARDPLYVVRGKHLARANLSFGRSWSTVVLAEVRPNGEAPFIAGEPFEPKAQAKLEWSAPGGAADMAVTAGAGHASRGWFGEYASLWLTDGLSVYADAVHRMGSRAWMPVEDGAGDVAFAQAATGAGLRTLALAGVRYTFAGGPDVRLEYAFDEAGWDEARLELASRAAAAPAGASPSPAAIAAWLDPGFEILGRQHAYASVRLPELPPAKRTTLQLRYLAALEDGSGAAFVTASYDATGSAVLFVSALATHGKDHGALSRIARASALAGAIVSW